MDVRFIRTKLPDLFLERNLNAHRFADICQVNRNTIYKIIRQERCLRYFLRTGQGCLPRPLRFSATTTMKIAQALNLAHDQVFRLHEFKVQYP